MFSKAQIHHKSPPRPNSTIIPNSFDIKNMPNPTAPSEPPVNPQIKFENHKKIENLPKVVSTQGN